MQTRASSMMSTGRSGPANSATTPRSCDTVPPFMNSRGGSLARAGTDTTCHPPLRQGECNASVAPGERREFRGCQRGRETADVGRSHAEAERQAAHEPTLDLQPPGPALRLPPDPDHRGDAPPSHARLERQRIGIVAGEPRTHATQGGGAAEEDVFGRAGYGYFL